VILTFFDFYGKKILGSQFQGAFMAAIPKDLPAVRLPSCDELIGGRLRRTQSVAVLSGEFAGQRGVIGLVPDAKDLPKWAGYVEVLITDNNPQWIHLDYLYAIL